MIYLSIYFFDLTLTQTAMKFLKVSFIFLLSFCISFFSLTAKAFAASEDFQIVNNMIINYTTGEDFVKVENEYTRSVENSKYYFPATSEKIFHIPDIQGENEEKITAERDFKIKSLTVTDEYGKSVKYSIEKKNSGEGIYVTVPNYKETTSRSPYKLIVTYNTHDYIKRIGDFISIIGTSLPKDTQFSVTDKGNNTITAYNYNLSIVTDENIPTLSKAYPEFTTETKNRKTYYNFTQTSRLESSPFLEFGTSVVYRFEMSYVTPKTDNIIPEKYSSIIRALSANIYEISLPREFGETNQRVYFENVSPSPIDIYKDEEGNVIALFEVPANKESAINITGYITLEQNSFKDITSPTNTSLSEYLKKVDESSLTKNYLKSTKYWESNDSFIVEKATELSKDITTLKDLISADYKYVNDTLDYDDSKANSDNERIGAVAALKGGGSVCMEYADSMIAILRAQGVPARAALGYANLSTEKKENQIRHQWVQIWIPDYGWYSIDPTFESSNQKVGQQIDRILWETFNSDTLSNIRVFSADNVNDMTTEGFSLSIYGVADKIDTNSLNAYGDLVPNKDYSNGLPENNGFSIPNWFNTFLKATVLGRALVITIPALLTLAVLIVVIQSITLLVKRLKNRTKKI
ncbi:transglutaminase family protein [Candidatus Microgenomates bacterium]|nr:transglutaminase family protein [Candidatus Microgenomates bacterium]